MMGVGNGWERESYNSYYLGRAVGLIPVQHDGGVIRLNATYSSLKKKSSLVGLVHYNNNNKNCFIVLEF
jgi:hypothetical protein